MAIGRYRDVPDEMDDVECAVAAAQYPEGGLMLGLGLGIVLAVLTTDFLVVVAPFVLGAIGFVVGRRVRDRKVRTLRKRDNHAE